MSRYELERFNPKPDPDLVCAICQSVLDTPLQTTCNHVFCKLCIETWLTNRETCPNCRKTARKRDLKTVLPILRNLLNRLQVHCKNLPSGCETTYMMEYILDHEKNCAYEIVPCCNPKCISKVTRKDIVDHEKTCDFREVQCTKKCGLMILVREKNHDCLLALKAHVAEQQTELTKLRARAQELEEVKANLERQLTQVREQLDGGRPNGFMSDMSDDDGWTTLSSSSDNHDENLVDGNSQEHITDTEHNTVNDNFPIFVPSPRTPSPPYDHGYEATTPSTYERTPSPEGYNGTDDDMLVSPYYHPDTPDSNDARTPDSISATLNTPSLRSSPRSPDCFSVASETHYTMSGEATPIRSSSPEGFADDDDNESNSSQQTSSTPMFSPEASPCHSVVSEFGNGIERDGYDDTGSPLSVPGSVGHSSSQETSNTPSHGSPTSVQEEQTTDCDDENTDDVDLVSQDEDQQNNENRSDQETDEPQEQGASNSEYSDDHEYASDRDSEDHNEEDEESQISLNTSAEHEDSTPVVSASESEKSDKDSSTTLKTDSNSSSSDEGNTNNGNTRTSEEKSSTSSDSENGPNDCNNSENESNERSDLTSESDCEDANVPRNSKDKDLTKTTHNRTSSGKSKRTWRFPNLHIYTSSSDSEDDECANNQKQISTQNKISAGSSRSTSQPRCYTSCRPARSEGSAQDLRLLTGTETSTPGTSMKKRTSADFLANWLVNGEREHNRPGHQADNAQTSRRSETVVEESQPWSNVSITTSATNQHSPSGMATSTCRGSFTGSRGLKRVRRMSRSPEYNTQPKKRQRGNNSASGYESRSKRNHGNGDGGLFGLICSPDHHSHGNNTLLQMRDNSENRHGTASQEMDDESSSDFSWHPSGNASPSDVSISDDMDNAEVELDATYKVRIPPSTAELLERYKSCDESDDSWHP